MAKEIPKIELDPVKCRACDINKPLELFVIDKRNKNGHTSTCKECYNKRISKSARYYDKDGNLKCRECREYKSEIEYHTDSTQKYRNSKAQMCKACEANRARDKRLKDMPDDLTKVLASVYNGIHTRAAKQHEMSKQYLQELYEQQGGKCAISGIHLTYKRGKGRFPYNISADQIVPGNGYTKDNVQLVCSQVNMMKGTLSTDELISICKSIIKENGWVIKKD